MLKNLTYRMLPVLVLFFSEIQPKDTGKSLEKAQNLYSQGQYDQSIEILEELISSPANDPNAEKASVVLTDAYLQKEQWEKADKVIERFRKYYVGSPWTAQMMYYKGLVLIEQGNNYEGGKLLIRAINLTSHQGSYQRAFDGLKLLISGHGLTADEIKALVENVENAPQVKFYLLEKLGDLYLETGRASAAKAVYTEWLNKNPYPGRESQIKEKWNKAKSQSSRNKTVLVMAPLTGELSEIGTELAESIILGLEKFNEINGLKIGYRLLDTRADPLTSVRKLRKVLYEEDILAIIGPAMSDVTVALAVELSSRSSPIPLISPTATTYGIANLGPGVFQLNVSTHYLGRSIAAFASKCLDLKEFAILAPDTEYGKQISESFQETVENLGGSIIAEEYFLPDENDYQEYFRRIRTKKALMDWERSRIEKGKSIEDPPSESIINSVVRDSLLSIGGFFLPASIWEEAYKLSSQTQYHKINTQMLGSTGWFDRKLFRKRNKAIQGAYLSMDFLPVLPKDTSWSFVQEFEGRWGRAPGRVAKLGFSAVEFLKKGIEKSHKQEELIPALQSIKSFRSISGAIVFDQAVGSNKKTKILQIKGNSFVPVDSCVSKNKPDNP